DEQRGDHRLAKVARRFPGHDQANQIEMEGEVDPPTDESTDQRRHDALGAEWSVVPMAELEHVASADQRNPHQRGHARRAATQGTRPEEPAPPATAIAETGAGSDTEIRRRRLRSHRRTKADRGDDGQRANRRQAPGEALLLACGGDDVAGDIGLDGAPRKGSPWASSWRDRAAPPRAFAPAEHM